MLAAPRRTAAFVDRFCEETRIEVEWELGQRVWREAGTAFQRYSVRRTKQRGPHPRRILADFLIGAHAFLSGYRLLTLDAGIYQTSFPKLQITTA
jgi:predicted nucleic acid-binding protein